MIRFLLIASLLFSEAPSSMALSTIDCRHRVLSAEQALTAPVILAPLQPISADVKRARLLQFARDASPDLFGDSESPVEEWVELFLTSVLNNRNRIWISRDEERNTLREVMELFIFRNFKVIDIMRRLSLKNGSFFVIAGRDRFIASGKQFRLLHLVMRKKISRPEFDAMDIGALNLNIRSENMLRAAGKQTIGSVMPMTEEQLMGIKQLGKGSAIDILDALHPFKQVFDVHSDQPVFVSVAIFLLFVPVDGWAGLILHLLAAATIFLAANASLDSPEPSDPLIRQDSLCELGEVHSFLKEVHPPEFISQAMHASDALIDRLELLRDRTEKSLDEQGALPDYFEGQLHNIQRTASQIAIEPLPAIVYEQGRSTALRRKLADQARSLLENPRFENVAEALKQNHTLQIQLDRLVQSQLIDAAYWASRSNFMVAQSSMRGATRTLRLKELAVYNQQIYAMHQQIFGSFSISARLAALEAIRQEEWKHSGVFPFREGRLGFDGFRFALQRGLSRYASKFSFIGAQKNTFNDEFSEAETIFFHIATLGRIPYMTAFEPSRKLFNDIRTHLIVIRAWARKAKSAGKSEVTGDLQRAAPFLAQVAREYGRTGQVNASALGQGLFWVHAAQRHLENTRFPDIRRILEYLNKRITALTNDESDLEAFRAYERESLFTPVYSALSNASQGQDQLIQFLQMRLPEIFGVSGSGVSDWVDSYASAIRTGLWDGWHSKSENRPLRQAFAMHVIFHLPLPVELIGLNKTMHWLEAELVKHLDRQGRRHQMLYRLHQGDLSWNDWLDQPIEELYLPQRTAGILRDKYVNTIRQLWALPSVELDHFNDGGPSLVQDVERALAPFRNSGLYFRKLQAAA